METATICNLMDKLTLNMLVLMEEEVKQKLQVEKAMKNGDILIAKTRYSQGSQSVSSHQLPTEDSREFNALVTLNETTRGTLDAEEHEVDKATSHFDPMNLFGILTPQSLASAAKNYKQATLSCVDCANNHIELNDNIEVLKRLKQMKEESLIQNVLH